MNTLQRTFSIIKPDAVAKGASGDILHMIQEKGFRIIGMKMLEITKQQAEGFYAVHASRPFFDSLTSFMSSGPIVVLALGTWTTFARLVRAETLSVRERDWVLAARLLGAGSARILVRHILPQVTGTLTVTLSLMLAMVRPASPGCGRKGRRVSSRERRR